jgi:hypothetical protein
MAPCFTVPVILTEFPKPKTVPSLTPSMSTTFSSLLLCALATPKSSNTQTSSAATRFRSIFLREKFGLAGER